MANEGFFDIEYHAGGRLAWLWLNRPERKNLMDSRCWDELPRQVAGLEANPRLRVVLVAARGAHFSGGLDLKDFFLQNASLFQEKTAQSRAAIRQKVLHMQQGFNAMAWGKNVYVACVQGWCIGAGLDLIAACDLRLASETARVSLRETRVAIVADLGSLQRLPHLVGEGNTRLMAFTGADFDARQCHSMGLFQEVCPSDEALLARALELGLSMAENPAGTLQGVKHHLNARTEAEVRRGLGDVATWNSAFLDSPDLAEAVAAFLEKRPPNYG